MKVICYFELNYLTTIADQIYMLVLIPRLEKMQYPKFSVNDQSSNKKFSAKTTMSTHKKVNTCSKLLLQIT